MSARQATLRVRLRAQHAEAELRLLRQAGVLATIPARVDLEAERAGAVEQLRIAWLNCCCLACRSSLPEVSIACLARHAYLDARDALDARPSSPGGFGSELLGRCHAR